MKEMPEVDFPFKDEDDVELVVGLDSGTILRVPGKFKEMERAFTAFYGARNAVAWEAEDKELALAMMTYGCSVVTCGDNGVVAFPFSRVTFMQIKERSV